tara:strand:+ start:957 stop:2090 length:1134 start_codon:yes stop_codon:yes gene_type:complete
LKKKVYYWSPFLSPIATCKSVINSAFSLSKFSNEYQSYIFNFFNEFHLFEKQIKKKNIEFINFYNFNFSKYLPFQGKLKSRFSFIILFILGFFPLIKILKTKKPDYLIIHLISSLPLIILILFKFETKFILRISGFPKLNFFRKFLWKIAFKKIHLVTCPTKNTLNYIKSFNFIDASKVTLLYDPVLNVAEMNKKKKENIGFKNFYLSVGRLTKQKNFMFLCEAFKRLISENNELKLIIAGNGEDEEKIKNFINKNNLKDNIILLGYIDNIYPYFYKAKGFILTSLWEDPGFVLVEALFFRKLILSSDAWPGPVELIRDFENGFVFENENLNNFLKKFKNFNNYENDCLITLNAIKSSKKFSLFSHYQNLNKILSIN